MRNPMLALVVVALFGTPLAAQGTSSVTVVHGIPGVTVDVYVNGGIALEDFAPGSVAGPLDLSAGSYRVQIVAANETDLSKAVIDSTQEVPAGKNVSLAAHLAEDGTPALSAFLNDLSPTGPHKGRVVVRHLAAAPEVNVFLLKGWWSRALLRNLSNGDEKSASLYEGTYTAFVIAANSRGKVVAEFPVTVKEGEVTIAYAVGSLAAGTFGVVGQSFTTTPPPAKVTVVHGVPGLTVDVFLNGSLALPGFEPKTITDPIELPAGKYAVAIAPAGAGIDAAVIRADVEVTPGLNASVVAHLDAAGGPTASVFVDDLSPIGLPKGKVVVRHVAAAPDVDVRLSRGNRPAGQLTGLANGEQSSAKLFPGRYRASVFPAGGTTSVLGPATLNVKPSTVTTIYAIGSLSGGTLELLSDETKVSIAHGFLHRLFR